MTCRGQELCEGRGDRLGLRVANSPYGLCGRKATFEEEEEEEEKEEEEEEDKKLSKICCLYSILIDGTSDVSSILCPFK